MKAYVSRKHTLYFTVIFVFAVFLILIGMYCKQSLIILNAENISSKCVLTRTGSDGISKELDSSKLLDNEYTTYSYFSGGDILKINSDTEFSSIYIVWNKIPGNWTIEADGNLYEMGKHGFLHEYVDIKALTGKNVKEISVRIPKEITVCDVNAFTEGNLPDWVQIWQPPCEKADIMLLSTHSDDEQLFYAGLLPYYAGEVGAAVQVVYLTNHWDTTNRPHEQINGLWTVGVRNYPIVGPFPDDVNTLNKNGESVQNTLDRTLGIFGEENLIKFQVEMIRRFKPQVIVGHDVNGEYQHGAHIANTYSLQKALEPAANASLYTESYEKYGVWDVPKTYIHLWESNKITMNWDIPLEKFGGKTAFEVSKEGYLCHRSQQWTWFTRWLTGTGSGNADTITKASEIKTYSPCEFGLYRTTVGQDSKADFLDNIVMYQDQAVITPEHSPTDSQTDTPATNSASYSTDAPVQTPTQTTGSVSGEDIKANKLEDALIYIAMILCVIAIILIAVISSKKKKRE